MCVCVCVCVYIYIYMRVCVCVYRAPFLSPFPSWGPSIRPGLPPSCLPAFLPSVLESFLPALTPVSITYFLDSPLPFLPLFLFFPSLLSFLLSANFLSSFLLSSLRYFGFQFHPTSCLFLRSFLSPFLPFFLPSFPSFLPSFLSSRKVRAKKEELHYPLSLLKWKQGELVSPLLPPSPLPVLTRGLLKKVDTHNSDHETKIA